MKIKAILKHTHTKRDTYGNVYWACTITNPVTGKSITVDSVHPSNIRLILYGAFGQVGFYEVEVCTDSKRINSLPELVHFNPCQYDAAWKAALNGLGYRKLIDTK